MIRVKITKSYKNFNAGETVEVSKNVAFDLLDRGVAVMSKDLVSKDHVTKSKTKRVKK